MRWPLVILVLGIILICSGILIHETLASSHPYHPYSNFKPTFKNSNKSLNNISKKHPSAKSSPASTKSDPSTTTNTTTLATPKPSKPISAHNLLAADADFISLANQTCLDDNLRVPKVNSDYHVGMWYFEGPDKHGAVVVHCRGFMEKNSRRVWFDLDNQNDTITDTLYVRT